MERRVGWVVVALVTLGCTRHTAEAPHPHTVTHDAGADAAASAPLHAASAPLDAAPILWDGICAANPLARECL